MHILKKLLFLGLFLVTLQPLMAMKYTEPLKVELTKADPLNADGEFPVVIVDPQLYNWWVTITNMLEDMALIGATELPIPNMNLAEYNLIEHYMKPIWETYDLTNDAQKATAQKTLQAHLEKDLYDKKLSLDDIIALIKVNNYLDFGFMLDAAIDALATHLSPQDFAYICSQLPEELVVMIVQADEKRIAFDWLGLQHIELQHSLTIPTQDYYLTCMALSPDDTKLAAGSHDDGIVTIWDTQTGEVIDKLQSLPTSFANIPIGWSTGSCYANDYDDHNNQICTIHALAWSPNKVFLAYSVGSGIVSVWDIKAEKCINLKIVIDGLNVNELPWNSLEWSTDNAYLITVREDGVIAIWDFRDPQNARAIRIFTEDDEVFARDHANHLYELKTIAALNQNNILATLNLERETIKLFDILHLPSITKFKPIHPAPVEQHEVMNNIDYLALQWSPDGTMLAVTTNNGVTILKHFFTDHFSYTILSPSPKIKGLSWAPDSKRISICTQEGTVEIWNAIDGYRIITIAMDPDTFKNNALWSPHGTHLAMMLSNNKQIILFSLHPHWRSTLPKDLSLEQVWLIKMAYQAYQNNTQCVLPHEFFITAYGNLPQKVQAILASYVLFTKDDALPANMPQQQQSIPHGEEGTPPAKKAKIESPTHP